MKTVSLILYLALLQVRTVEDAKDAHKKELRRVPGKDAASKVAATDAGRRAIQATPLPPPPLPHPITTTTTTTTMLSCPE